MGFTDSISETNDKAIEVGERYLESTVKYYKLKLFKQLTMSVSMILKALMIGGLSLIGLLLLSLAISILIGNALGSYAAGFIIVAVIFFLSAGIAFYFKDKVTIIVLKKMSKIYFKEENNAQEESLEQKNIDQSIVNDEEVHEDIIVDSSINDEIEYVEDNIIKNEFENEEFVNDEKL